MARSALTPTEPRRDHRQPVTSASEPSRLLTARLPKVLTGWDTWGFGFTGLLLWLFVVEGATVTLGQGAWLLWLCMTPLAVLFNLQVKRMGESWPDVAGGTPNYTSRLLQGSRGLRRYAAACYFVGWASVPTLSAMLLADLVRATLDSSGVAPPLWALRLTFTVVAFVVAWGGTRTLGVLHLFFLVPAVGGLVAFCLHGMVWLASSPASPGLLPGNGSRMWSGFGFGDWAKWYVAAAYAIYGVDSASSFVTDSRKPRTTLRCLKVAAAFIPLVYLGGSLVVMRLQAGAADDGVTGALLAAAARFWGPAAPWMVTFLVASACMLGTATATGNCPRIIYQLARDGDASPVFASVSPRGVPGPALMFTLLFSVVFLAWGDATSLLVAAGTGYFCFCILMRLGLWLQRGQPEARWPRLSLAIFVLEAAILLVGGISWGWEPFLVGLVLPFAVLGADAMVRRVPLAVLGPGWWIRRYRPRYAEARRDAAGSQVAMQILLVCLAAAAGWGVGGVAGAVEDDRKSLFVILIVAVGFLGIAAASWTTLWQVFRLAGERDRANSLLSAVEDAILVTDDDGIIRLANPASEKLLTRGEPVVERELGAVLLGFHGPPAQWPARSEDVLEDPTGAETTLETRVSTIRSEHLFGRVLVVRDISERKRNEMELAKARDEALAASRAKSDFLAVMSHEIRTPMNGVIGLTGLLLDSELSDTQRHHAEGVRASGEALLGIINDILDFSKIEAGKLELETVDFDLAHAMEEVAGLVAQSARAKGLELVAYSGLEVPIALRGDVGRLRQILLNLATNAVRFTDAGEVVLRSRLAEEASADEVVVRLEVADTGVGVDPTVAAQLFDPFSQADASTTRRYGGTGLGLAISRRLAEAMGGNIGLESKPGEGSTFWVQLPFERASDALTRDEPEGHSLQGRKILVVDDNQTNRLVLASQLRAWDITADLAPDARVALELLHRAVAEARPYDLALVDMAMPEMDGLELGRMLGADPTLASTRLVLLSSVAVEADAVARAGFVARLTKPVRLSHLYDALVRAVTPLVVERKSAVASPTVAAGRRGTLLIVEDNAINQEVAKGSLAKLGYASDVAGNGIEALEALERRSYDAVLMDCHMPEMDGFQATAEIRRREAGRHHVPIIAMTAGALVEDREKCIAAGMDDYLAKPVKYRELEATLNHWLGAVDGSPENAGADAGSERACEWDGTAPPLAGNEVLDLKQFDGLRQLAAASGDPGFLARFVDQYLDEATSRLSELQEAAQRGDAAALREAAHSLKGTSATMGAIVLASASAALEAAAGHGVVPGPTELVRVSAELERTATALRAQAPSS